MIFNVLSVAGATRKTKLSGFSLQNKKLDTVIITIIAFLACFILAFIAGSFIIQPYDTKAATGLGLAGSSTMTLSTNAATVSMNTNPSANSGLASGLSTLTASTNVPTGYSLSLSATSAGTLLTPTTGTITSPTALADNTWGFALASASAVGVTNGLDASYATPTPSSSSKWANPTTTTTIKNTSSTASSDTTNVYYGIKAGTSLTAGTYSSTVTYTATANITNLATPSITSVAPSSGSTAGGTAITIVGTGFTASDKSVTTAVTVGGTACTSISISSNTPSAGKDTIYCNTPAHAAGAVNVAVTTWKSTATLSNGYTYDVRPSITSISPNTGHFRGGETLTITGTNLTGATAVSLGDSACQSFTVVSATSITCVSSGAASSLLGGVNNTMTSATNTVSVNVTTPDGTNTENSLFTYGYINKSGTTAGSYMDIIGADITAGSSIYVNGIKCTNLKITSATTAACNTPVTTAGSRAVTITAAASSQGNMQNWTGCSSISNPAYTTTDWSTYTRVLTDTRNGQTYRVRKMPDGKCWMIDDLKLANYTLTSADSNVSSNFTIPANPVLSGSTRSNGTCVGGTVSGTGNYLTCDGTNTQPATNFAYIAYLDPSQSGQGNYEDNCLNQNGISSGSLSGCGYLYNWYTATAGTGTYDLASGEAASSICPAGWKLPTGNSTGQFAVLNNAMATGQATASTTNSVTTRPNWRYTGPFEGSLSGNYDNGFVSTGHFGYYWSSTTLSSTVVYCLGFDYSIVGPGTGNGSMFGGLAVRCIAN